MKRIVQCPKCEAKLSVFDSGKPISQKCPKCGNTFEVTPEGAVEPSAPEATATPPSVPEAETSGKEKPVSTPAAQKPTVPAASATLAEPVSMESGPSLFQVLGIPVLLFIILAVQVWTFKSSQSHINRLEDQIHTLATLVQKLKNNP